MTRKERGVVLRNNRVAVGRTRSGPPVTAEEHRAADARQRQAQRDRADQLHGRPYARPYKPGDPVDWVVKPKDKP